MSLFLRPGAAAIKPGVSMMVRLGQYLYSIFTTMSLAHNQGLTHVHCSAQRKRFLGDRGCIQGWLLGCCGGIRGFKGVFGVYFVSEMAQVELRLERV